MINNNESISKNNEDIINKEKITPPEILEFLTELGKALTSAGTPVIYIQSTLTRISEANGVKSDIIVFPTFIIIKIGEKESEPLTAANQTPGILPLDQVSRIYELIHKAEASEISPLEGTIQLKKILTKKSESNKLKILTGYILFSLGLGMLLIPTPNQFIFSGILEP
jgi:uncharacterized membrane protein YjjP (DUF1212 family)